MLDLLYILFLVIITTAGISLWREYFLQRQSSKMEYLYAVHPTPFGLIDVLAFFLIWIMVPGMISAVPLAIWGFPSLDSLTEWQMNTLIVISSIAQLTVCLAAVGFLLHRYGTLDRVFGATALELPNHFKIAGRAFCMVVPIVLLIQILLAYFVPTVPYQHDTINQLRENFSLNTLLATWLGAVIAAPICEEILFRGVLQGWLQRVRFGETNRNGFAEIVGGWDAETDPNPETDRNTACEPDQDSFDFELNQPVNRLQWWMPIVVSSAMFAAVHIGQGLAPIALFVFALGLGFLYRFTGSIVPSIILHFLLNAFSMSWVTLESILVPVKDAI